MYQHYKAIYPLKYYQDHIDKNIRPDGRKFNEFHKFAVSTNTITSTRGSSVVKIGNTKIVCAVRAEIVKPAIDTLNNSSLILNVDFPQICSSKFRFKSYSKFSQRISHQLTEIVEKSQCFNQKQLEIAPNVCVWNLFCDFVCLSFDGSIMDALLLSFAAAIQSTQLPKVTYLSEIKDSIVSDSEFVPLRLTIIPFAVTFSVFNNKTLLTEPTEEEEELSQNKIILAANLDDPNEVFYVNKVGLNTINDTILDQCFDIIEKRASKLKKHLNNLNNFTECKK